ncbi:MMPL family transporter [Promicromonospora sp. Populi]|uniref:MMPL family transporter n=1 Tax=Promicromonospora sp. Populi TaxID=3239420 RepID=UPI0034E271B3
MSNGTRSLTVRTARWCATHPWRAVVGWLLLVVVCLGAGTAVGTNSGTIDDFWVGEAGRAESMADSSGLMPAPTEQVLITANGNDQLDAAAAERAANDVRRRMEALPAVTSVAEPAWSADRTALLVDVTLRGDNETAEDDVAGLLEQTAATQAAHTDVTVEQTGGASMSNEVDESMGQNLLRTEAISLPVTFVILLVVFGTVLAAGIPILLALTAFTGAVGLYGLASWIFPDAGGAAMSVIFLLGMAVGVDYSLFYLKRIREERAHASLSAAGQIDHTAAIEAAAATSGRAVLGSGIAVVLALGGLYLADDVIFSSIATGAILVTALAVVGSLTVLPALLALLGGRIDRGLRGRRRTGGRGTEGRARGENAAWTAVLRPVVRRPLVTLLVSVAVTGALAAPALTMKLGTEGAETFPDSLPTVATYDRLTGAFPSQGPAHLVLARGDDPAAPLQALADRTRGDELFAQDQHPEVVVADDGTTALLRLPVPFSENSAEAQRSLDRLRAELVPEAMQGAAAGTEIAVSGEVARGVDYAAHQAERLPWVIVFVSLTTLVIMFVVFRSVPLALLGVVLNLATVLVSWGVLTLVFQGTWAEGLLGFDSVGFVGSRTPLMVVAILVGLSTDYQIFVVSRIREAARRGLPTRQAVVKGIAGSASVVTSAAVIMVSIFGSFLFFDRIEMKQMAVGLTVAVLFDAIVLRALILPSVITLLGERTWWPVRMRPSSAPVAAPGVEAPGVEALQRS